MSKKTGIKSNDRYAKYTWNVSRSADFGSPERIRAAFAQRARMAAK